VFHTLDDDGWVDTEMTDITIDIDAVVTVGHRHTPSYMTVVKKGYPLTIDTDNDVVRIVIT